MAVAEKHFYTTTPQRMMKWQPTMPNGDEPADKLKDGWNCGAKLTPRPLHHGTCARQPDGTRLTLWPPRRTQDCLWQWHKTTRRPQIANQLLLTHNDGPRLTSDRAQQHG